MTVPFVSPTVPFVLPFCFPAISSFLHLDLSLIYNLEAFESRFAGLIGLFLLLLLVSNLGWFPEVDDLCCSFTHFDAFGEIGVYRTEFPILVPTLSSGSLVASDGFGLVVCSAAEMVLADQFWVMEICVRFCLDLVILRFLV